MALASSRQQLKSTTEFNIVTPTRVFLFRVADDTARVPRTSTPSAAAAARATASSITARQWVKAISEILRRDEDRRASGSSLSDSLIAPGARAGER
jgi:hypothetical protein